MRNLVLLPALLILSACVSTNEGNVGVESIKIPDLPVELSQKAERLPDITDNTMGGRELSGVETDRAYNAVAFRLNNLIDLYTCVQKSINSKQTSDNCFK